MSAICGHIPCFVVVWACECLLHDQGVEYVPFSCRKAKTMRTTARKFPHSVMLLSAISFPGCSRYARHSAVSAPTAAIKPLINFQSCSSLAPEARYRSIFLKSFPHCPTITMPYRLCVIHEWRSYRYFHFQYRRVLMGGP